MIKISKRAFAVFVTVVALLTTTGISMAYAADIPTPKTTTPTLTGLTLFSPPELALPDVTITVTLLRTRTVTLPRVTDTVTLPRATTTVTQNVAVPQSVRTVTVPGPVSTTTVTQSGSTTRQTATRSATIAGPGVTIPAKTVTESSPPKGTVTLTRTEAVGVSLGLIALGVLLAVLLTWAAFTYGWFKGDSGNREFLKETIDDLRYDK